LIHEGKNDLIKAAHYYECFTEFNKNKEENKKHWKLIAEIYFTYERYFKAVKTYGRLLKTEPYNIQYLKNK